jgi:hypothetical protein
MKLGYKRIILDYHFSSFLPQTLTAVDAGDYVRRMKEAGVESFLVYAKDHWGHVYHKTAISHKHPNAPDDLFGELLGLCRANGIIPFAYTCVMWDEFNARTHPEWRARDAQGLLIENAPPAGAGWHHLCVNTPYQDFFMAQLEELAENYDFPGLFVDILFYNAFTCACYCDGCRAKWQAMYGREMPLPLASVGDRVQYAAFRDAFYREFYGRMNAVLARHGKADILVTHNFGGTDPSLPTYLGKETEPFGQDYVIPQIIIKDTRNRAHGREVEIYFGRFNRFWDFTVKSKELLRWETVNCLAHDTAAIIIDQPLLDGRLDPQAYKAIGFAYRQADKLLDFTAGSQPYAEIGVYHDHLNYEATGFEGHEDFVGACKLLMECHLPYDLVTDFDDASALGKFAAVVLPHTPLVHSKMQAGLQKYVHNGGVVICEYTAGAFDEKGPTARDSKHFLVDVSRHTMRSVNFIQPGDPRTEVSGLSSDPRTGVSGLSGEPRPEESGLGAFESVAATYLRTGKMLELSALKDDKVLGMQVPGAVDRNQWVWVSHNVPPDTRQTGAAVIVRKLGKGKVLYFNSRIFSEYLHTNLGSLRQFIRMCIEQVCPPRLWLQAPSIVDAIFQRKGDARVVTLNCCTLDRGANASSLYYGTQPPLHANINESWPIAGMRLWSRDPIVQAKMLDGTKLTVGNDGPLHYVDLPPIEGFGSVELR